MPAPTPPSAAQLLALGLDWIPRIYRDDPIVLALLSGSAAVAERVALRVGELYAQTLIATSTGVFLDQHLVDRGTARQDRESDTAARERARTIAEAATPQAIRDLVDGILAGAGLGPCAIVELREAQAFYQIKAIGMVFNPDDGFRRAYFGRGDRFGGRQPSLVIVVLPFGTSAGLAASINAAVGRIRSAGYPHRIEIRQVP